MSSITDIYRCPRCGWATSRQTILICREDYFCPRCGETRLSEFRARVSKEPQSRGPSWLLRMLPKNLFILIMITFVASCMTRGGGLHNFAIAHGKDPLIYRGAAPGEFGIGTLAMMGVKTVIDLRTASELDDREVMWCVSRGIVYCEVPVTPLKKPKKMVADWFVKKVAESPGPVFVHCVWGSDRTSAMIAYWKHLRHGIPGEALLEEAKIFGIEDPAMKEFILDL